MKVVVILAVATLALVWQGVSSYPKLPLFMFPCRTRRCCAQAHQCFRFPIWNTPCNPSMRPKCKAPWHNRCRQSTTLLKRVWVNFSDNTRLCCRVMNCPKIYYSACTFQLDKCRGYQRLCGPERYIRRFLALACPGMPRMRYIYRYFPHCCRCQYCPLRYFQTLSRSTNRGK